VELLDERWTVLVIRELLAGIKYFNAMRAGDVVIDGPTRLRRQVPRWFGQSVLAEVPRPKPDIPRVPGVLKSA
jgi:hypothetical protein